MDVTLYSSNHCPDCDQAREQLAGHNVDFHEINLEEHAEVGRELFERCGSNQVPLIDVDGQCYAGVFPPLG
ncbi:MAG: glutaredoxin family protein [Candidatus Geothermincolia bacterium]